MVLVARGCGWCGSYIGGQLTPEFAAAPWDVDKDHDLLKHLWIPAVVHGTAGMAGLMRVMRANLLDELGKPYVQTALAKGLHPVRLVIKYPMRIAINPFISTFGWLLPHLISGAAIISIVLILPTPGPLLLPSPSHQDIYLAGSFLMMLSNMTGVGRLLSDIRLAIVDPRFSYE